MRQQFGRGIAVFAGQRERNACDMSSRRAQRDGSDMRAAHTVFFAVQKGTIIAVLQCLRVYGRAKRPTFHRDSDLIYFHVGASRLTLGPKR